MMMTLGTLNTLSLSLSPEWFIGSQCLQIPLTCTHTQAANLRPNDGQGWLPSCDGWELGM